MLSPKQYPEIVTPGNVGFHNSTRAVSYLHVASCRFSSTPPLAKTEGNVGVSGRHCPEFFCKYNEIDIFEKG
jgi:hypothetical protein